MTKSVNEVIARDKVEDNGCSIGLALGQSQNITTTIKSVSGWMEMVAEGWCHIEFYY